MDEHLNTTGRRREREAREVYRSRLIGASLLGLGFVAWWTLESFGLL